MELGPLLNRKPRQLSGGQRQRVALGRAIVREPQAFLLDEPLSNLDAKLRVQTRIELQKQHRALHATFIYVTHDQVEAMTMGDRIAVMRDGVLQQVAPPREIYDQPANMYVAGFIGSPTMNFIPVTVQGKTATASGFEVPLPTAPGVEKGILGLRPEAMRERFRDEASQGTANGAAGLDMKVEVTEVLGADQFVYGLVGTDSAVTARVDPNLRVSPGDRIRLVVDTRRVHLFDQYRTLHVKPARVSPGQTPIGKGTEIIVASMDLERGTLIVEPLGFQRSATSERQPAISDPRRAASPPDELEMRDRES